jgi:hypothetical protein
MYPRREGPADLTRYVAPVNRYKTLCVPRVGLGNAA